MKQLWMTNDKVKHPKAIPRTLYVVTSTPSACRMSEGISMGHFQGLEYPHSPKTTGLADDHP